MAAPLSVVRSGKLCIGRCHDLPKPVGKRSRARRLEADHVVLREVLVRQAGFQQSSIDSIVNCAGQWSSRPCLEMCEVQSLQLRSSTLTLKPSHVHCPFCHCMLPLKETALETLSELLHQSLQQVPACGRADRLVGGRACARACACAYVHVRVRERQRRSTDASKYGRGQSPIAKQVRSQVDGSSPDNNKQASGGWPAHRCHRTQAKAQLQQEDHEAQMSEKVEDSEVQPKSHPPLMRGTAFVGSLVERARFS